MSKAVDTLANVGYVLDGIPQATEQDKVKARKLLISKGAYDIMEILGLDD